MGFFIPPLTETSFGRGGIKKPTPSGVGFCFVGGERGIRTPGGVTLNGFQDRRIRPLCHLSGNAAAKVHFFCIGQ